MIVKNEAPVIRRCLDSVRPLISHWVIVDTGSTDGTQDIIREHLNGIPGTLYERPWRDFAHNRSEALRLARRQADYSLIIDADDALELAPDFAMPPLLSDCYMFNIADTGTTYGRKQLVSNRLRWFYRGVLHEFVDSDGPHTTGHLPIVMRRNHDGARQRDPNTYRRDAEVLERALKTETDPFLKTRYTFYLAQSYWDCKDFPRALELYSQRARLGGWVEEVFVSLWRAAQIMEKLGRPDMDVIQAYEAASNANPARAEALHDAARFCRERELHGLAYDFARRGMAVAYPADGLFVLDWVYQYGLLDELAVSAYWCGHYRESLSACERLLSQCSLPDGYRTRIAENAQFAREMLPPYSMSPVKQAWP